MKGGGEGARRRTGLAAPLVVAALSALVTLPAIGRASLWWDECHSVVVAEALRGLGPGAVLAAIGRGLSPYFLLLAPWAGSGTPEWALRLPSALAAAATATVASRVGRELGGPALGWRLGVAIALSPFMAWHAREARWYTWTWLFGALALLHALRALRSSGWRDSLLTLVWGLGAALTFAPAAAALAVMLVGIALQRLKAGRETVVIRGHAPGGDSRVTHEARRSPMSIAAWSAAGGLVVLAGLVWGWRTLVAPALGEGGAGYGFRNVGAFSLPAVAYTPVAFATGYTLGPGPAEWRHRPLAWPSPWEILAMAAALSCLAFLAARGWASLRERGAAREAAMVVALAVIPAFAAIAASAWTGHRFAPRHAGAAFLPLMVLAAAGSLRPSGAEGAGAKRAWPGLLATLLLLGLQFVSLVNLHRSPRYLREQVGPAAAHVAGIATARDMILVFGGIDLPWRHYEAGATPARIVYADDPATWTPDAMRSIVAAHDRVIVVRGLIMGTPEEAPLLAAVSGATRLVGRASFPGVEVEVRAAARTP